MGADATTILAAAGAAAAGWYLAPRRNRAIAAGLLGAGTYVAIDTLATPAAPPPPSGTYTLFPVPDYPTAQCTYEALRERPDGGVDMASRRMVYAATGSMQDRLFAVQTFVHLRKGAPVPQYAGGKLVGTTPAGPKWGPGPWILGRRCATHDPINRYVYRID